MSELGKNLGNAALGIATGGIHTAVNAGLGLVFGDKADRKAKERQFEQQKKLQELQLKGQKELNTQGFDLSKKMWDETNYGAQLGHMKEAGLSPGLMYGQAGAGGSTQSGTGGSVAGGSASSDMSGVAMGLQLGMMNAQKENIEADTEVKKKDAGLKEGQSVSIGYQNWVDSMTQQYKVDMQREEKELKEIEKTRENASWESYMATGFKGKAFDDPEAPINKALKAGWEKSIVELQNAKNVNDIQESEKIIKEFEAGLAEQGIPPNSPWGIKLIGDLLEKTGIGSLIGIGKDSIKNEIKK